MFGQPNVANYDFNLYTLLQNGGVWHASNVRGEVVGDSYLSNCSPQTDPACLLSFGPATDGTYGWAEVYTDAVSPSVASEWTFEAAPDSNCSLGASSGDVWIYPTGYGPSPTLTCGQADPVGGSVEPTECTVTYVNNQLYEACPSIIEMIADGGVTFPTNYALDINFYDVSGNWQGGEQATALSSSIVQFSAPTGWGINVVTVTDPSTNLVLAAAGYTLHECLVTVNPPYSSTDCPY